ncbi:hypothetical protein BHM03_00008396 [Ensete ventricosum]|nr:hypothetical protein BHM03_00008396 [Ensete ventricosum]
MLPDEHGGEERHGWQPSFKAGGLEEITPLPHAAHSPPLCFARGAEIIRKYRGREGALIVLFLFPILPAQEPTERERERERGNGGGRSGIAQTKEDKGEERKESVGGAGEGEPCATAVAYRCSTTLIGNG